jgi:hypothetical protein
VNERYALVAFNHLTIQQYNHPNILLTHQLFTIQPGYSSLNQQIYSELSQAYGCILPGYYLVTPH